MWLYLFMVESNQFSLPHLPKVWHRPEDPSDRSTDCNPKTVKFFVGLDDPKLGRSLIPRRSGVNYADGSIERVRHDNIADDRRCWLRG